MATIKVTSCKSGQLRSLVNYLTRKEKTEENLISGKDCNPANVIMDFMATKELYNKKDGRQYYHYIQSFKPGEISHQKAHQIGIELAENQFKGYEVFIVTHKDKKHIHNHLVVNSVSFENGKKFHTSKYDLKQLKEYSDKICEREGLSVIKESKGKYLSQAQVKLAQRGENRQLELIKSIKYAKIISTCKNEYIKNMDKLGYKVNWTNTEWISYIDKELQAKSKKLEAKGKDGIKYKFGQKALSKYVNKEKLTKTALENAFKR